MRITVEKYADWMIEGRTDDCWTEVLFMMRIRRPRRLNRPDGAGR